MRTWKRLVPILLCGLLIGCAAATPTPQPVVEAAPTSPSEPTVQSTELPAVWMGDGVIGEGEYAHSLTRGKVTVHWRNTDEVLWLAMVGETEGWVSVGLDPVQQMKGADYVIGAVQDGQVQVWDAFGTAAVGATHPVDDELGGQDDIIAFGGREADGVTVIEVQKPLDSGDAYDKPLAPGKTYAIIVAVGASDDFDARHSYRGSDEITLD